MDAHEPERDSSGQDHALVLELDPAAEWPLQRYRPNYGGNIAVEKEVIEDWLEVELGLTGLGTSGRGKLSTDLLIKKPFRLSPTFEFMNGAGPEITRTLSGSDRGTRHRQRRGIRPRLHALVGRQCRLACRTRMEYRCTHRPDSLSVTGGLTVGFG